MLILAQKDQPITILQGFKQPDGRTPLSGVAGTIGVVLRHQDDTDHSADVTITEQATSGFYEATFTPGKLDAYILELQAPSPGSDLAVYPFNIQSFNSVQFSGLSGSFLTTLAAVKEFLGIDATETQFDNLLGNLIARVTDRIELETDRRLIQGTSTEVKDGEGHPELYLHNPPIDSISTVHQSKSQVWDSSTLLAATSYLFKADPPVLRRNDGIDFLEGFQNVRVVYVGGFGTIPAALEQAAIQWVSQLYQTRERIGISSESLRETSISYKALPDEDAKIIETLIAPWKRTWV